MPKEYCMAAQSKKKSSDIVVFWPGIVAQVCHVGLKFCPVKQLHFTVASVLEAGKPTVSAGGQHISFQNSNWSIWTQYLEKK